MAATFRIDVVIDPAKAASGSRKVRDEVVKVDNAADKLRANAADAFNRIGGAADRSRVQLNAHVQAFQENKRAIEQTAGAVRQAIGAIEDENRLLGLNVQERNAQRAVLAQVSRISGEVTDAQREEIEAAVRSNQELQRRAAVLQRINGPQEEFESDLRQINVLLDKGTIDQKQYNAELKRMRAGLKGAGDGADRFRNLAQRAFAGIGIALVVRELGQAVDAYTNLQNRVRTVTTGQAELDSVTRQLFQTANDTRGAFDATAEVYARTALAAKDLGITQEQTLAFTKSLNQAVALGGSSAEEARAGMIQLSQGLASGALRGDELRSVLEQLPVVADVIAKSLGVTRGELRELGAQGKITAQDILVAFEKSREELDERFAKSVPTLGQSFQVLKNNVIEYVGAADTASGTSAFLAGTILFLGENLGFVIAGMTILAVSTLPAVIAGVTGLIASSTILSAVFTTALFNPVVLGAAAAGAAVILLIDHFVDVEEAARNTKAELDKFLLADDPLILLTIQNVQKTLDKVRESAAQGLFPNDGEAEARIKVLTDRLAELRGEQAALADGTGRTLGQIRAQAEAVRELDMAVDEANKTLVTNAEANIQTAREMERRRDVLQQIKDIEKSTGSDVTPEQEKAIRLAVEQAQALRDQAQAFNDLRGPQEEFQARLTALKALQESGKISLDEMNLGLAQLAEASEGVDLSALALPEGVDFTSQIEQIRQLIAAAQQKAEEEQTTSAVTVAALQEEQAVLALLAQGRNREAALLEITNQLKRDGVKIENGDVERIADLNAENDALAFQAQLLQEIVGPQQQFEATQAALNVLLTDGAISADQYAAALENAAQAAGMLAEKTTEAGDSAGELPDKIGPAEKAVNNALAGSFQAAEDALVGFVRTGEFEFEKFVDQLLDQIARLLVQQAILALFGGTAIGTAAGLTAKAEGGEFNAGDTLLVGEEGPEIITAKGAGDVIPAGETAARMSKGNSPTVNVAPPEVNVPITNMVVGDISGDLDSPEGEEGVLNIIRRNPDTVRRS
tara:strand:+ start:23592 stop:26681 length:3090 start_codon:yes stop_codon:yes gene_type:complete